MALLPTRTYSRRNNELSAINDREKENVDPFDELLTSPLKQDVQFQPLSYWGKEKRDTESKKKSRTLKCGLFETSDSDENSSLFQRKRKPKSENFVSKRTLQCKSSYSKLSTRRNNSNSTSYSLNENTKHYKSIKSNETKSFMHAEEFEKTKERLLNKTLYPNENMEETLKLPYTDCNNFKHNSTRDSSIDDTHNLYNYLHSVPFKTNKKNSKGFVNEKINQRNSNFKIYKDIDTSPKQSYGKTIVSNNESVNKTTLFSESMEETLKPYKNHDSFKYINVKKQFNYPTFYTSPDANFDSSLNSTVFNGSPKCSKQPDGKTIVSNNESVNKTTLFSESMEETLKPYKDRNSFKYINVKRQFNYPNCYTSPDADFDSSLNSTEFNESQKCSSWLESSCSSKVNTYEDVGMDVDCMNESGEINSVEDDDDGECFIDNTLVQTSHESLDKTFTLVNSTTLINEVSDAVSIQSCESENSFTDSFDNLYFRICKLKDLIQELEQNENTQNLEAADVFSTSDDTFSEPNDEDTVIRVALEPETNPPSCQGSDDDEEEEIIHSASPSSGVSQLTSRISDLNITSPTDDEPSELEPEKSDIPQGVSNSADKEDSFMIDLRNVTTKRRGFLNNKYGENVPHVNDSRLRSSTAPKKIQKENNSELDFEFDQTLQFPRITDRMSVDWNKTVSFANPIFESTRVLDMGLTNRKVSQAQNLSETVFEESALDHTYFLKPGKKWLRSISVLKQIQNGNISESTHDGRRITGRKFESFVQDMVELQNANCKTLNKPGVNVKNSSSDGLSEYESVLNVDDESEVSEFFSINDSILTKSITDKSMSEKVLLNRTVKVIQPEEGSSAFRSALGLETSHVISQVIEDSIREENSCISARNFILIQCGQEDVLPFEEYFNERTLVNCRKIGEGVYGEVFMCSNTVIKIIPIEGLDKVNGESQKTFEEIISEVVIASKLSNLRNGEKHQTDGFSEMKRCWCVKGKYPKHLLDLWNEYDELGSGSENDSPVMFKDDQLYIILELANGGKDLESFVFNSAAQSLSVFIQAAFSLAVAEKAFEFEHRDLHWGNVLISETKDKFMTVILDGTEYKIPTKGVKVCIIDFTLSRMYHEGCCIFNDLSVDPGLFASEGDYQFEIYRMMLREVKNDWSLFRPRNNLFWLHYTLDKMIKMVRYKNKKAKIHAKHLKDLKTLESVVLEHQDSTDFVLSSSLSSIMNKL